MKGDVVIGVLDTEVDKVERDLGPDGNVGGDNLRQSPQDGTKWVCRNPLLVEFLEGGHVVNGVSNPNVLVDDTFCLALDEGGDVDGGGARGANGGEGFEQSSFEGVPIVDVNAGSEVDAAGVGEC